MNTRKQIFLIVVLMFTLTGGCAAYAFIEPIRSERQSDFFQKESIRRGALLFANNCRGCHGNAGEGGIGLPLNTAAFKVQDPLILQENQDLLRHTIECGRAGTPMPAWLRENGGPLTEIQITHLIRLITAPGTEVDEATGELTNLGWEEAVEFAHNLNADLRPQVTGDTLGTIATAHQIGYEELAALNEVDVDHIFRAGDVVELPWGDEVELIEDKQLIRVAEENHVGAVILAELNGIEWEIDDDGNFNIYMDGELVPGLLPGRLLELPEGALVVVRSGDTLLSVADAHNISAEEILEANPDLELIEGIDPEDEIPFERPLELPEDAIVIVQEGDTFGTIATTHAIEPTELIEINNLTEDALAGVGDILDLPPDTTYIIQPGDTLFEVALRHGIEEEQLAELNDLEAGEEISPAVVLQLPPVDEYVVQGQTLEAVAEGFANTTALSLALANDLDADALVRIGTTLELPEDSWGPFPSLTTTSGDVCLQYAMPQSVYQDLFEPQPTPTAPAEVTSDVEIIAHANDWTIIANGEELPPNEGAVTIPSPTEVRFFSEVGLHTVTVDDETLVDDLNTGDEFSFTFEGDPETSFYITCDYHPDMKAWVYIGE